MQQEEKFTLLSAANSFEKLESQKTHSTKTEDNTLAECEFDQTNMNISPTNIKMKYKLFLFLSLSLVCVSRVEWTNMYAIPTFGFVLDRICCVLFSVFSVSSCIRRVDGSLSSRRRVLLHSQISVEKIIYLYTVCVYKKTKTTATRRQRLFSMMRVFMARSFRCVLEQSTERSRSASYISFFLSFFDGFLSLHNRNEQCKNAGFV